MLLCCCVGVLLLFRWCLCLVVRRIALVACSFGCVVLLLCGVDVVVFCCVVVLLSCYVVVLMFCGVDGLLL